MAWLNKTSRTSLNSHFHHEHIFKSMFVTRILELFPFSVERSMQLVVGRVLHGYKSYKVAKPVFVVTVEGNIVD
jgi:hypothetical protein